MPLGPDDILAVDDLAVTFHTRAGPVAAVRDMSFGLRRGETLALVGESGSGKSVTSLALMRLTPPAPGCTITGRVTLRGRDGAPQDVLSLPETSMRRLRGAAMAMVFQEPMTSFNPVHSIGAQIAEAVRMHAAIGQRAALDRAAELLDLVGIPDPRKRLAAYPHLLSGGMRQRAMIAMALAAEPALLIADEPTTALDVTIQAQILDLLRALQQRTGMAMLFITHNLGVVADIADRVMVMYAGRVVEDAAAATLLTAPRMPYTTGLLQSVPRLEWAGRRVPLAAIPGQVPDPLAPPPGCAFASRCAHAVPARCDAALPALVACGDDHRARCLRLDEIAA